MIQSCVVYERGTGCIRFVMQTDYPERQETEDLAVLVGVEAELGRHYVDVSGEAPVLVELPPRPSLRHTFYYVRFRWVLDAEHLAREARLQRHQLLSASDWTQLPDVPEATRLAWQDYRQALRDITGQPGFPEQVEWPTAP